MGSCLSILRKPRPQSESLASTTPGPQGPATSGTSPGCAGQEQATGAGEQLQHAPAPPMATDENEETGILKHDHQTHATSGPSLDCAGQEQDKVESTGTCDQIQHVPSPSGPTDESDETGIDTTHHTGQGPAISNPSLGYAGQEQGEEKIPGVDEKLQHVPSCSMDENEEMVITAIRASDVTLGLRRLPVGFYIMLHYDGLELRTENKPSSMNNSAVEWSGPIPIPSDLSAIVRLEVYASFEFQPMLGAGERLQRLTATVGQLSNRSAEDAPFTFFPEYGDVVSPCSSIFVAVQRQKRERNDPSGSRVVGPNWSTPEPREEIEDTTDLGHSALSRYRKRQRKQDLERSIEYFERALNICPPDDPRCAAAKSNLATAKLIVSQVEGTYAPLEVALRLSRDALIARPAGHPDRPLTLIQLALVHLTRLQRWRDRVNEANSENAEGLLHDAIKLSDTTSYERRAAAVMLQLCAGHRGGRVQWSDPSSAELDFTASSTEEGLRTLSTRLLERFERFGDLVDLQQVIAILEGLVKSTPSWDPNYCVALGNLGNALSYRFERLGQLSDLEDAISNQEDAIRLTPDGHPYKPAHLNNLGISFETRFQRLGRLIDLEDAISRKRDAVDLTPHGHPDKPSYLNNLGNSFEARFQRMGQLSDLEEAISRKRDAVDLTPDGHPDKPGRLNNLGISFETRFQCLGQLSDLEDAISNHRNAVDLTPDGHPDKPGRLNNLGVSFKTRFHCLGQLIDLEDAISRKRDAVDLTPDDHPNKPAYLNNLGNSFETRFQHMGRLNDLEDAISRKSNAVDLTPDDHPNKPTYLNNLGASFYIRSEHLGQLSDLEDAVSRFKDAVHLTPDGHPDKPRRLNNLGASFEARFQRLGQLSDLEDAISKFRDAVILTPDAHPDKPGRLGNLGASIETRFKRLGRLSDLEDAILKKRDAVDLTPDGHPDKPGRLNNLGNSFGTRFQRFRRPGDLENAISIQSEAVDLTPDGHPDKPRYLNNLGNSLEARFQLFGRLSDLENAISRKRDAVQLTPQDHPHKPVYLNHLAKSFAARFLRLGQVSDMKHALSLSSHVASIPIGPASVRFSAAQLWIQCARLVRHSSLLHAHSVVVSLTPQLAWIGLSLSHRYDELTQSANVIPEAAAAALEAGYPQTALEWLEQGRSVVWGDLFQLRTSYDELSSAHPGYANRFHALSSQLDQASAIHEQSLSVLSEQDQSGTHHAAESLRQVADRHRAFATERDKLLQEIRQLPGFEKFLLRKPFSQLRAAAHSGPVVILNAAETRCDALIVVAGVNHVIHVPLPNFNSERCANLQVILKSFVRDTRVGKLGRLEGVSWDTILSPLWKCIVKPVLDALGFSVTPKDLSRIFWCPTGALAFLPIHAAGFYNEQYSEPGHKIFDFVVSSYVPTLSTLLRPSNPVAARPSGPLRLLLVPQPPSDGQSKLPGVAIELRRINYVVSKSPLACTTLEPSDGTVEEVLELMRHADWVHFACHGVQDGVDSGLCLANRRRLKLRDIVALSRPPGGLAFLSACQTAKGEQRLSDEAVHIAAGMLFAGYGGVVGTMWSISDAVAPDVAKDVYEELLGKCLRTDYRKAAWALHEATKDLRRRGKSFDEWIPFIHVGL